MLGRNAAINTPRRTCRIPPWLVHLWLTNDPATDTVCRQLVAAERTTGEAGEALKAYVEEESPLTTLDASIKAEIGAERLIRRGFWVLAVSSLINFLSMMYFLGLVISKRTGS